MEAIVNDYKIDSFIMSEEMLMDKDSMLESQKHLLTVPMEGSISSLVKSYKEKIMIIYRALLEEKKIIIFGEKTTTSSIC